MIYLNWFRIPWSLASLVLPLASRVQAVCGRTMSLDPFNVFSTHIQTLFESSFWPSKIHEVFRVVYKTERHIHKKSEHYFGKLLHFFKGWCQVHLSCSNRLKKLKRKKTIQLRLSLKYHQNHLILPLGKNFITLSAGTWQSLPTNSNRYEFRSNFHSAKCFKLTVHL